MSAAACTAVSVDAVAPEGAALATVAVSALALAVGFALLSIVAVLIPLSRVLPPLVELRIRSRVFRWYGQLREIEAQAGRQGASGLLEQLDAIESRVNAVQLPLSYADELYALKSHIQLVRRRLQAG